MLTLDNIKSVDDLVRFKNLTEEELESHKNLIEEFRERERKIQKYSRETRENINSFSEELHIVLDRVSLLGDLLRFLMEEMDRFYLKTLPASNFYRE